jgi:beta propeller repeat protein
MDNRNLATTGWDIYKWDPVNGEQSVCIDPGYQEYPAISGNTIVWMDNRNFATTGWDIYMASTPPIAIQNLRVKVVSLKLPAPIEKGLTDKLDASNLQINKMQYSAAQQSLTAFIYQVKAQTGKAKNLNQATANELITTAQRIINSIPKK